MWRVVSLLAKIAFELLVIYWWKGGVIFFLSSNFPYKSSFSPVLCLETGALLTWMHCKQMELRNWTLNVSIVWFCYHLKAISHNCKLGLWSISKFLSKRGNKFEGIFWGWIAEINQSWYACFLVIQQTLVCLCLSVCICTYRCIRTYACMGLYMNACLFVSKYIFVYVYMLGRSLILLAVILALFSFVC